MSATRQSRFCSGPMRENLLLTRRTGTSCTLSPSFGTAAGFEHRRLANFVRYSLAPRRPCSPEGISVPWIYWGVPRSRPLQTVQEWPPARKFRMADRGHRARKAKSAQFVSSSFLDCICCCCCITGLPSLGCINCSSLKLRRMESNSTAEPFAWCAVAAPSSGEKAACMGRTWPGLGPSSLRPASLTPQTGQTTPEPFLLFAQLDVGILDDLRPFGDVGVDDGGEFVW